MKPKNTILLLALAFFLAAFISCTSPLKKEITKHYSEEMLQGFEKICDQQKKRDSATHLLDSVYKTFPDISIPDKYRYYDFKQKMFELVRFGDHSYDTAINYVDSMIATIENNGLEKEMSNEYIKAFNTRGEYYTRLERYNDAIKDIVKCKQLNEKAGDSCLMAENTKTLSSIAVKQSNYHLAASLMKDALVLLNACKNDEQQFKRSQRYLDDLGFIYASMNKYDSALLYHVAAIKYIEQNKQVMVSDTLFPYVALDNIYSNIGIEYGFQKKFIEAEIYLKKAMLIEQDNLHDSLHLAYSQYWLGTFYLENRRIHDAQEMAEKSTLQIHNFEPGYLGGLIQFKIGIAKEKKEYKKEAIYREQLAGIKDSLNKVTVELLKKNPFVEYEQLDKKYQVELLKKDNRNQQNKTNAAIALGILLTILIVISLYFIQRLRMVMKKRSKLYKELKKTMAEKEIAEKQLREKELFSQEMRLQMEFNEAIIKQRRQISDDMHDELSSSLAALKFYVEDVKNRLAGTASEKSLSDIGDEVNSIYQNARSYMHSLKTNNWETPFSLIGFLKDIQQKFSEKSLMKIKLDLDEDKIKTKLTTIQHDQLYHIIRESISNVIKHAGAAKLTISILFDSEKCNFNISDNGCGYKKDNVNYGIGINSINKRVKDIGGDLEIDSSSIGTTIKGYFPVN